MGNSTGFRNSTVLITGGKGYLASFLSKALQACGACVVLSDIIDVNEKQYRKADLTDKGQVKRLVAETRPDFIFHLGALIDRSRNFEIFEKMLQVNTQGTLNLLEALVDIPYEKFVFASTSEVYGDISAPFSEEDVPKPASPYSLSKYAAENAIAAFSSIHKKPYCIARVFNFFGPGMNQSFFIPAMLSAFLSNSVFKMTYGEQLRDFLFVDDVVDALMQIASSPHTPGRTVNVCSGEAVSVRELALLAKHIAGSSSLIEFGAFPNRENEVWEMQGNPRLLAQLTGFMPKYTLDYSLSLLVKQTRLQSEIYNS